MSKPTDEPIDDFDSEAAIFAYQKAITRREQETTPEGKAEFDPILKRMRAEFAAWQGEDCLHEMAYGEKECYPEWELEAE